MSKLSENKKLFRTQLDDRLPVPVVWFPSSIVQRGQSPSISQIVRTRRVGGNELDDYYMDGILEDAPFDSEYLDIFDMEDIAQAEAEREASEAAPQDGGQPPTNDPGSESSGENDSGNENE